MADPQAFLPPYLRYGVAADLAKINARIAELEQLARKDRGLFGLEQIDTTFASGTISPGIRSAGGFTRIRPNIPIGALEAISGQVNRNFAAVTAIAQSAGAFDGTRPVGPDGFTAATILPAPAPSAQKAAGPFVAVAPDGKVVLGFNCCRTFSAHTNISGEITHIVWNLLLKDQQKDTFERIFFMGGTEVDKKQIKGRNIKFDHDFSSYRDSAYTSFNKTAIFAVECRAFFFGANKGSAQSDPITLDFNAQSCVGIHSVSVDVGSIVGGDNDKAPTLTVALDGPAGPGGQRVALSVDNHNLGNIMGSGSFLIPQGQTSGQLSWFLGTRKVAKDRTLTITAQLVSPGGNSGPGHVTVTLTRK